MLKNEILNKVPGTYRELDVSNLSLMVNGFYSSIFKEINKEPIYRPFALSDFSEDLNDVTSNLKVLEEIDDLDHN